MNPYLDELATMFPQVDRGTDLREALEGVLSKVESDTRQEWAMDVDRDQAYIAAHLARISASESLHSNTCVSDGYEK